MDSGMSEYLLFLLLSPVSLNDAYKSRDLVFGPRRVAVC